jgi:hypothetical protein
VQIEQLNEPPDANPAAEFALCELHGRLIEQPAQQHRIEIAGKVDGDADPLGPGEVRDELVAGGVGVRRTPQFHELLIEVYRRHRACSDVRAGVPFGGFIPVPQAQAAVAFC